MSVMDSKLLALAFLLLLIADAGLLVVIVAPTYYILQTTVKIGDTEPSTLTNDCGLFYMTTSFFSNLFLQKVTNTATFPYNIILAQLFFSVGAVGVTMSTLFSLLLVCKKYMTVPGNIILAGFCTAGAICQVISVVVGAGAATQSSYTGYLPNGDHPQFSVDVTITLNWAFYIQILVAVLALVSAPLLWVEACKSCRVVEMIRYQQLREELSKSSFLDDRMAENFSYVRQPRRGPAAPAYTVPAYQFTPQRYPSQPSLTSTEPPPSPAFIPAVQAPPSPQSGYVSRQVEI